MTYVGAESLSVAVSDLEGRRVDVAAAESGWRDEER